MQALGAEVTGLKAKKAGGRGLAALSAPLGKLFGRGQSRGGNRTHDAIPGSSGRPPATTASRGCRGSLRGARRARRRRARSGAPPAGAATGDAHYFQQVKGRVHRRLIERLNLSNLERVGREQVVEAIRKVVARPDQPGDGRAQLRRARAAGRARCWTRSSAWARWSR